jgi:hypothetical protein
MAPSISDLGATLLESSGETSAPGTQIAAGRALISSRTIREGLARQGSAIDDANGRRPKKKEGVRW